MCCHSFRLIALMENILTTKIFINKTKALKAKKRSNINQITDNFFFSYFFSVLCNMHIGMDLCSFYSNQGNKITKFIKQKYYTNNHNNSF